MGERLEKVRKVRSDRKRDVKPTIDIHLKDAIFRIAFITNTPAKDVAEQICINGINKKEIIEYLSQNFRRTVQFGNTFYMGDVKRLGIQKQTAGSKQRITIRFRKETYDSLAALAYALDCTISKTCALLLEIGIRDFEFVDEFIQTYIEKHVDETRMKELEAVMRYIKSNQKDGEEYTWAMLLSFIIEEMKGNAGRLQDTITQFIVSHWNKK